MGAKKVAVNSALLLASTLVSIVFVNILYIIFIRDPRQSHGFPRHLVPDLPTPSRWLYADTGSKGNSRDIALLGDSYLEAIGDEFSDGVYNYSLAHFLHQRTGLQIAQHGTGGSYLPRQVALYEKALAGDYWPLYDRVLSDKIPNRIILFFYEGNDLNDYISSTKNSLSKELNVDLPWTLRYFPIARFVARRLDYVLIRINSKIYYLTKKILMNMTASSATSPRLLQSQGPSEKLPGDRSLVSPEMSSGQKDGSISMCGPHYCLPAGQALQGPALDLTEHQRDQAIQATVVSIIHYSRKNPDRQVCLVYIPSPAVIYSPLLPKALTRTQTRKPAENTKYYDQYKLIRHASQHIRANMFKRLREANVHYVDATPNLLKNATLMYLHGRQDVNHFNQYGYKSVVESIVNSGLKCLTKAI